MLADLLKTYLASTFAYYLKSQFMHWNIEGPDFGQLHKFFQKIYEDAYSAVDPIADYIRTTEEYAPGSLSRFQELSQIQDQTKVPRARLMLEELLADTQTMISMSKQVFDAAKQTAWAQLLADDDGVGQVARDLALTKQANTARKGGDTERAKEILQMRNR